MIGIKTFENGLVSLCETALSGMSYLVEANTKAYEELNPGSELGGVYIRLQNIAYRQATPDNKLNENRLIFEVALVDRNAKTHQAGYDVLELILDAIKNNRVENREFNALQMQTVGREDNKTVYSLLIYTKLKD